ncbi:MAG TPA: alpha/beta fold hydrolase [Baekduia sp.]|uniref:alpha/beta fold hydrolase n=1 Tax=Baekduia sp. TaxID=2600305 RepID=UPI002B55A3BF|nr:alpha/beta fold hydrolase [Baekduia sp.]HMJ36634.1 alpha/beta fold hydrolase [Baekduia sp.]
MQLPLPLSPDRFARAAANTFDMVFKGGVADLRPTPARIIDEAPQRTIFQYLSPDERSRHLPVLLIPPLAAPTICFDLRRGCSMAEHLLGLGHPTYMVDYGSIAFSDRELGLEHWVQDVLPATIEKVSAHAGGRPVQVVGWCLGGIMALLALAARPDLPVNSIAAVASPFDFAQLRMFAPLRGAANLTNGLLGTAIYRALGGAPAPIVKRAFQLSTLDKYLTKPVAMATHLDDREFLAQIEAVDHFLDNMHAYPGRTMGQLYHRFFRVNDLADGRLAFGDHDIDLAAVRVPVLAVAGQTDTLAPRAAVHHVGSLLTGAPEVQLKTGPGGHLGVLAGRAAGRTAWRWIDEFFARHEAQRRLRARGPGRPPAQPARSRA